VKGILCAEDLKRAVSAAEGRERKRERENNCEESEFRMK
jgi:hypothetical protein